MIRILMVEIIQALSLLGMVVCMRWLLELSTPKADWQAVEQAYDRLRLEVRELCGAVGLSLYSLSWGGQTDPRIIWLRVQMRADGVDGKEGADLVEKTGEEIQLHDDP